MADAPELENLMERYLAAQLAGDREEAVRLVLAEGLGRGFTAPEVHLHVIGRAQREIGRLWQDNRITVAQEHLATAISQVALTQVFAAFPRGSRKPWRILVACVEGELHDMGARIAADFLDAAGYGVTLLGANVATETLLRVVDDERPDVVALTATMTFHLPALRDAVERLRSRFGTGLPLVVGGHAVAASPDLDGYLGARHAGGSARELVELVDRLVGGRPDVSLQGSPG